MNKKKYYCVWLLPLLLLGCSSQPEPIDHLLLLPEAEFSQQSLAQSSDIQWWPQHNDLALSHYIEQALDNNQDLLALYQRLLQAQALRDKTVALEFPSVNAGINVSDDTDSSEKYYNASLDMAYEIDLWRRIQDASESAEAQYQAQRYDYDAAAISLSAAVADAWYGWVESQQKLLILQQQQAANKKNLDIIALRFRVGAVNITDVTQQRQQLESVRARIVLVKADIANSQYQLNILLGRGITTPIEAAAELPPLNAQPATGLPLALLSRRPDVQSAWLIIQGNESALASAIKDRYPRINLSLTSTSSAQHSSDLFSDWLNQLVAGIVLPIVDGGSRRAEIRRQQALVNEAVHNYNSVMLNAIKEVEAALINEQQQAEYLNSISKQKQLAYFVLERKTSYYRSANTSYLDVLAALTSAQDLALQQITAEADLLDDRVELYRAIAGGWSALEQREAALQQNTQPKLTLQHSQSSHHHETVTEQVQ